MGFEEKRRERGTGRGEKRPEERTGKRSAKKRLEERLWGTRKYERRGFALIRNPTVSQTTIFC
jgi:hypothetical protein